jgi:two-component system, OmpR family, alkaline phosphatase synthesis response regulator PhoP
MEKQRILIVDDDREILRLVRSYLEQAGYMTLVAGDGETALQSVRSERPDLILLDLTLPKRSGWEITRIIRSDETLAGIPIIMLTARVEDVDKILGLELGADDYITKPFNLREVVARVNALLRRSRSQNHPSSYQEIRTGQLRIDIARHEVWCGDRLIELTPTEFNLLRLLAENPGIVYTRSELVQKGMGYEYAGLDRTLDSHIKNLRQKIEINPKKPAYIQTIYGIGYRFTVPE